MFPNIEYVLWAIAVGLVIANTIGGYPFFARFFGPGVRTYEFFLKLGIVLLGARFLPGDVRQMGALGLVLVPIEIVGSLVLMTVLGRWFGLNKKLTDLLAVGSGICGVSAIIATQGAIEAEEKDSATAIAAILAIGAFELFLFPVIGGALHLSDKAFGFWAGLGVDNTAEVVATGALFSDAAAKYAALVKTFRNATIGLVVLYYAYKWAKQGGARTIANKGAFL